jgi:hypothetical protein
MVWETILLTGLQFGMSAMQGNAEANAAKDANAAATKQAKERHELDLKLWELDYLEKVSAFEWDNASVAAQRYQERVREYDYNTRNTGIIEAALQNLELNSQSLQQTYVTEELLRAQQVSSELTYGIGTDSMAAMSTLRTAEANSLKLQQNAKGANLQTMANTADYLKSIQTQAAQADRFLAETDEKGQAIQEQILTNESLLNMRRDAASITALVSGAEARNRSVSRQGGSNSSQRLGLEAMQKFGRSYGEMQNEQKRQRQQLSAYNSELSGSRAAQLAAVATQIDQNIGRIKSTSAKNRVDQQGYLLEQMAIGSTMNMAQGQFNLRAGKKLSDFTDLTIPSFGITQAQGKREATALVQNTVNKIKGASVPYRGAIILDPREPIAGLKPEFSKPTQRAVPGAASIYGRAFGDAAKTAIGSSYIDTEGNRQFR